ncbi:MAG: tRNA (guanosine(37)-N1)-methyltransferase TrmD [Fimbriimonadales bacterium]|nr:tRNA (guanosine(37)-N1)-methyltransferase TrmD [Fimbriimonadales bacterium]
MRVGFVTLFPDLVRSALAHGVLGRAAQRGLVRFEFADPRDFVYDRHRTVDDRPFGGFDGMLLKAEPVVAAVRWLRPAQGAAVVFTEPAGERFDQAAAEELSRRPEVHFVCGRYEGIDDRARQLVATHCLSLGDFVLTGGEIPALAMADAVVRLLPGVVGAEGSLCQDSHAGGLLSAPQFTRPRRVEGLEVPEELLSGDHAAAARWQRARALRLTRALRPDLFCKARLEKGDLDLLQ